MSDRIEATLVDGAPLGEVSRLLRVLEASTATVSVRLVAAPDPAGDPGELTLSVHGPRRAYVKVRETDERVAGLGAQALELLVFLRDACAVYEDWRPLVTAPGFPEPLHGVGYDQLRAVYSRLARALDGTDYPLLRDGRRGFAFYAEHEGAPLE